MKTAVFSIIVSPRAWLAVAVLGSATVGAVLGSTPVSASGPPSVAKDPAPKTPAPAEEPSRDPLATPAPERWLPQVRRCRRRGRRAYCDGPRRAPVPHGEAAARAEHLGLGTRTAARDLLHGEIPNRWLAAVDVEPAASLHWPVDEGWMGRGFGYTRRNRPRLPHKGIDIPAAPGSLVRAVEGGLVAYSDNDVPGYGNLLILLHPDGRTSHYAHLRAMYLFAGQRVLRGQVIGEVGNTGLSRGPHLHFEWRHRGRPRNPMRHFEEVPERPRNAREQLASAR